MLPMKGARDWRMCCSISCICMVMLGSASLPLLVLDPLTQRLTRGACDERALGEEVHVAGCGELSEGQGDVVAPFLSNVERFPFFEVIYAIMSFIPVSAYWQGIVGGWLYGTITVPVQNFRFRRKMERPIEPCLLWQAYPPTVLRDMAYGCSRCVIYSALARHLTTDSTSVVVTAFLFGVATWLACVFSSPLNEWRGYWVQPPNAKVPLGQFFKQESDTFARL
ncbi:unnamed protein product [Prorocentrum cordatum]|uniref:Uncharacterized protein n=1 Tax=Prorocentrum cordatum TaxID=2364126 RepID=A0ABN9UFG6_9DINO|nr:unnamed protein product [Polarella glacialis]